MDHPSAYRSVSFKAKNLGSYVMVYQRPNEPANLDINFFDGDRGVEDVTALVMTLTDAIALAKKWNDES